MPANPIVHFEIPVDDIERQKRFYSEAFGWKIQSSGMQEMEYLLISTGPQGNSVGGGMYKRDQNADKIKLYVGDDDLDGAIERFKEAGGTIVNTFDIPGMVKGALGTDPEGNQVGIIKNQNPSNQRSSKIGTRTPSGRSAKKAGKKSSSSKKKQSRTKKKSRKKH